MASSITSNTWMATCRSGLGTAMNGPTPWVARMATPTAPRTAVDAAPRGPKRTAAYSATGSTRNSSITAVVPGGTAVMTSQRMAAVTSATSSASSTSRVRGRATGVPSQVSARGTTASRPSAFMRHQPFQPE